MTVVAVRLVRTVEELELVHRLMQQYADWIGVDLGFQGFEAELMTLPGVYVAPRGALWLAWQDDQAIGTIAVKPLSNTVCEMKRFWVDAKMQGCGAGRALAQNAIKFARHVGYHEIKLDTLRTRMQPAIKLYRSLGFKETAPYVHNPEPDVLYLSLRLTDVDDE